MLHRAYAPAQGNEFALHTTTNRALALLARQTGRAASPIGVLSRAHATRLAHRQCVCPPVSPLYRGTHLRTRWDAWSWTGRRVDRDQPSASDLWGSALARAHSRPCPAFWAPEWITLRIAERVV